MLLLLPRVRLLPCSIVALMLIWAAPRLSSAEVTVRNPDELRAAVSSAKPGTRILLAGGNYGAGYRFANLRGQPGQAIVIAAADRANPPVFEGGTVAMHLSAPAHVEIDGLVFRRHSGNGINIDDVGGDRSEGGAHHLVLRGLRISDIGANGNQDGIKISGVSDFQILECTIERWGTRGGSAIDAVGCHRGLIAGNTLRHGDAPGCTGIQCKGGTSDIAVRRNRFESAGGRGVNIGGSTGLQFFRPPLTPGGEHAEARNIRVEGNTFVGGMAAVGFVGVDGAVVRFNTIERPGKWALRILQENKAAGFVPARNGEFTDNVIVFESSHWGEGGVNIGAGTAPETFRFARNWWFCADRPDRSQPKLPTPEKDGVYGREPVEAKEVAGASAWKEPASR